jgi:hypothetical protein
MSTIEIDLPAGWDRRENAGPFALFARPAAWEEAALPTISVLDTRSEAAADGFDAYITAQLAGVATQLHEPLLITLTCTPGTDGGGVVDLLISHDGGGHDLTVRQRHVVYADGRAIVVTATAADVNWPDLVGDLSAAVVSIRVPS